MKFEVNQKLCVKKGLNIFEKNLFSNSKTTRESLPHSALCDFFLRRWFVKKEKGMTLPMLGSVLNFSSRSLECSQGLESRILSCLSITVEYPDGALRHSDSSTWVTSWLVVNPSVINSCCSQKSCVTMIPQWVDNRYLHCKCRKLTFYWSEPLDGGKRVRVNYKKIVWKCHECKRVHSYEFFIGHPYPSLSFNVHECERQFNAHAECNVQFYPMCVNWACQACCQNFFPNFSLNFCILFLHSNLTELWQFIRLFIFWARGKSWLHHWKQKLIVENSLAPLDSKPVEPNLPT